MTDFLKTLFGFQHVSDLGVVRQAMFFERVQAAATLTL
jgi:hypothetical protein